MLSPVTIQDLLLLLYAYKSSFEIQDLMSFKSLYNHICSDINDLLDYLIASNMYIISSQFYKSIREYSATETIVDPQSMIDEILIYIISLLGDKKLHKGLETKLQKNASCIYKFKKGAVLKLLF